MTLLLLEASAATASAINNILQRYEACSGQMINREKSSILFSKNTKRATKHEVLAVLGPNSESYGGKYLGLPTYIGRNKTKCFEYLKDRIWKRIQGWKEK